MQSVYSLAENPGKASSREHSVATYFQLPVILLTCTEGGGDTINHFQSQNYTQR